MSNQWAALCPYRSVPQSELARFYADADAFVLTSREEGLALVQARASSHLHGSYRRGGSRAHTGPATTHFDDLCALVAAVAGLRDRQKAASPAARGRGSRDAFLDYAQQFGPILVNTVVVSITLDPAAYETKRVSDFD
jgi:hypothetical protein